MLAYKTTTKFYFIVQILFFYNPYDPLSPVPPNMPVEDSKIVFLPEVCETVHFSIPVDPRP